MLYEVNMEICQYLRARSTADEQEPQCIPLTDNYRNNMAWTIYRTQYWKKRTEYPYIIGPTSAISAASNHAELT